MFIILKYQFIYVCNKIFKWLNIIEYYRLGRCFKRNFWVRKIRYLIKVYRDWTFYNILDWIWWEVIIDRGWDILAIVFIWKHIIWVIIKYSPPLDFSDIYYDNYTTVDLYINNLMPSKSNIYRMLSWDFWEEGIWFKSMDMAKDSQTGITHYPLIENWFWVQKNYYQEQWLIDLRGGVDWDHWYLQQKINWRVQWYKWGEEPYWCWRLISMLYVPESIDIQRYIWRTLSTRFMMGAAFIGANAYSETTKEVMAIVTCIYPIYYALLWKFYFNRRVFWRWLWR